MPRLMITNLNHDLKSGKSYAVLFWSDDPSRHLGLRCRSGRQRQM